MPLYAGASAVVAQRLCISIEMPPWPVIELALLLATVGSLAMVILGSVGKPARWRNWLVCFVGTVYLVNVLVPHLPAALATRGYVPGLTTALLINLPVGLLLLRQARREGILSLRQTAFMIGLAVISLPVILPLIFWISFRLVLT